MKFNSYRIFLNFFKNNKIFWYDNDHALNQTGYKFTKLQCKCDNNSSMMIGFYKVYNDIKITSIWLEKLMTKREFDRIIAYTNHYKNYITIYDITKLNIVKLKSNTKLFNNKNNVFIVYNKTLNICYNIE